MRGSVSESRSGGGEEIPRGQPPSAAVRHLTLWCKSLLFNGRGYTVYDNSTGELVFRVESYAHDRKGEAVLMDSAGNALLTVRRSHSKKFRISKHWEAYKDDDQEISDPGLKKKQLLTATKALCRPSCRVSVEAEDGLRGICYRAVWSAHSEWLKIYKETTHTLLIAEASRKHGASPETLLGKDVLDLQIVAGVDQVTVMAMIMITDAMR